MGYLQDAELGLPYEGQPPKSEFESRETVPTVGRIVHYQSYGTPNGEYLPLPRAAIITQCDGWLPTDKEFMLGPRGEGLVGLAILNPTGLFFNEAVPYSAEPKPGHWNWPPRV